MKVLGTYSKLPANLLNFGQRLCLLLGIGYTAGLTGCACISANHDAIPASRLDPALVSCRKEGMAPLPFAALGQPSVDVHIIGPEDTLGVFIFGIFPTSEDETPVQNRSQAVNQQYYPPNGTEVGASTGLPVRVTAEGTVDLPLVEPISLQGLTIAQAV